MRHLVKAAKPAVLEANEEAWTREFLLDRENATKRYRYRNDEIKEALRAETGNKCVYCESRLGHNTPGDVEHMQPTIHAPELHFSWTNLSLACTECNRRKGAAHGSDPFLNPYVDFPEDLLDHLGPVVLPRPGNPRAEIFVRLLELYSPTRFPLIRQKAEKLWEVQQILERRSAMDDGLLKSLIDRQLRDMASPTAEYSAMIRGLLITRGILAAP